jgi:creatinine amidohydrolase
VNIADVAWVDVQEKLKSSDLLIVPLGGTETYGPHLATGTATYITEHLATELGNRLDCLVCPTFPITWTENLDPFPGNLYAAPPVVKAYVKAVCDRMVSWGIKRLFFLNVHRRNVGFLDELGYEYLRQGVRCAQVHYWALVVDSGGGLLRTGGLLGRGHGSELSVALALAVRPNLVFPERFRTWVPKPQLGDKYPDMLIAAPFSETTPTGHVGDPSQATAEQGRQILSRVLDRLEGFLREWE